MRSKHLFSLIVVIGAMTLAIALTINVGAAASGIVSVGKAPLDQLDRFQRQPVFTIPADTMAPDWVERHAASLMAGRIFERQTRDAVRARWLARYGGTGRTCVLLCGGA